ncbi:hypothetical protein [Sphingomonas sp. PvP018]|uniref:hypothetical protein n=1 Tax=Sphingomonas sp. PvP018 TaxID=2817852 RepID=UPI001AE2BBCC|nr:hypothetical protein [Sphingomonas sp. PvP018]MBP2512177.1 hypothetical protein [Sphingomonas sp. PvP018]
METVPLRADRDNRGRGASDAGRLHGGEGEQHLCELHMHWQDDNMATLLERDIARRQTIRALVREKLATKSLDRVRADLIDNAGYNAFQLEVMREWIAEKEAEAEAERMRIEHRDLRDARADEHAEESLRISRSAKNASWFATAIAVLALVVAAYAALRQYPINHDPAPDQRGSSQISEQVGKSADRNTHSPTAKERPAPQR